MRLIRSNVTFGAWCALFALAVQLLLSFGHVHLDGGGRDAAGTVRLALQIPAALPDAPALPTPPGHHGPNGAHGDFCAICALTHLAGTLVPASSPALPLPAVFGPAPTPLRADRALAATPLLPFQARGPPIA
jgi:hypothetical protein